MSYYFNGSLNDKIKALIPAAAAAAPETHPAAASVAKSIIDMMSPKDIVIKDGKLCVGPNTTTGVSEFYDDKTLARVEQDLKQEFKSQFGVNAEVSFVYGGHTDEPLPGGGKAKVHLYNLSIAVPV